MNVLEKISIEEFDCKNYQVKLVEGIEHKAVLKEWSKKALRKRCN